MATRLFVNRCFSELELINFTSTKAKKVLHPTRKPGQPSPKAEDSRLYSNRRAPKRGLCFYTNKVLCINTNLINSSHLTHVPPIMHALQWVQENFTPRTQRDDDTSVGCLKWAKANWEKITQETHGCSAPSVGTR